MLIRQRDSVIYPLNDNYRNNPYRDHKAKIYNTLPIVSIVSLTPSNNADMTKGWLHEIVPRRCFPVLEQDSLVWLAMNDTFKEQSIAAWKFVRIVVRDFDKKRAVSLKPWSGNFVTVKFPNKGYKEREKRCLVKLRTGYSFEFKNNRNNSKGLYSRKLRN